MADSIPRIRTRQVLARIAIASCVVMAAWFTWGPDPKPRVSVENGPTIYYFDSVATLLPMAAVGIIICLLAVVFWLQGGLFLRCMSVAAAVLAAFMFGNAPTGLNHRVVVDPEGFARTVGAWYAPETHAISFHDLAYLQVVDSGVGSAGHKEYALACCDVQTDRIESVPVFDLMRAALPEILRRASDYGIPILDYSEGRQLPAELHR